MNIQVRLGTIDDVPDLVESAIAMMRETEGVEIERNIAERGVTAVLRDPTLGFYVLAETENDRTVAGTLYVTKTWMDLRCGFYWWIYCVHVRSDFRRKGVYQKMYDFVKSEAARDSENVCLRLAVHKDNSAARSSYEKAGMHELSYVLYQAKL